MVQQKSDFIPVEIAARILDGLSPQRVRQMCAIGVFKSAHKPGFGSHSHWRILRSEVLAHKFNGHKRS